MSYISSVFKVNLNYNKFDWFWMWCDIAQNEASYARYRPSIMEAQLLRRSCIIILIYMTSLQFPIGGTQNMYRRNSDKNEILSPPYIQWPIYHITEAVSHVIFQHTSARWITTGSVHMQQNVTGDGWYLFVLWPQIVGIAHKDICNCRPPWRLINSSIRFEMQLYT